MPEGPFPDAVTDEDLPVIEGFSVDDEVGISSDFIAYFSPLIEQKRSKKE